MKPKLCIAIAILLLQPVVSWGIDITPRNFPDDIFRDCVTSFDIDHDGILCDEEIQDVTVLFLHDKNISDLSGIEHFTSLERLICDGNKLTNLDLSKNTELVEVSCAGNQLKSLTILTATNLEDLNCSRNQLTDLDVSGNTRLKYINVSQNRVRGLNVAQCTLLKILICNDNQLQTLLFSEEQTSMAEVYLQCNQIKDEAMTALVESLPQMTQQAPIYLKALDFDSSDECNVLTTLQAAMAMEKNCIVQAYSETAGWKPYNGLNPNDLTIDNIHFPDDGFRIFVRKEFDTDGSNALSHEEIEGVETIGIYATGVQPEYRVYNNNLRGIEFFTKLRELSCSNNHLKELDLSKNTALREIHCENNLLTSLVLPQGTTLKYLNCSNNQLASLDVTSNTELKSLYCGNNLLASLDVTSNTELKSLYCGNNLLASLDVRGITVCDLDLSCHHNLLTSLDLSKNTNLICLDCSNNPVTGLDVSNNIRLQCLICDSCQLTALDVSNNIDLQNLYCSFNQLTSLNLATNKSLQELWIRVNRLEAREMEELIHSLPYRERYAGLLVADWDNETEANEITKDLWLDAINKGWSVYVIDNGVQRQLTNHDFPDHISSIPFDSPTNNCFMLDGKKVHEKWGIKGIYIENGQKKLRLR